MELLLRIARADFLKMLSLIKGFGFYPKDHNWGPLPDQTASHTEPIPANYYLENAHDRDFWWHRFQFLFEISDEDAKSFAGALERLLEHMDKEGRTIPWRTKFENGAMFNVVCEWVESGHSEACARLLLPFFRGGGFRIERLGNQLLFTRELVAGEEPA